MKHLSTILSLLLFFFALCSCDDINTKKLYGSWIETETGNSHFTFKKNGNYTFHFEGVQEEENEEVDKGTFYIEKDVIYTQSKYSKTQETYSIIKLNDNELTLSQSDLFELKFIKQK